MSMVIQNTTSTGKLLVVCIVLFTIVLAAMNVLKTDNGENGFDLLSDKLTSSSEPIGGFSLVDHHDNEVNSERFQGYWSFVFFGFTNCPDVCPATLSQLVGVNKLINKKKEIADKTQIFFVSVDPARDSTKHLSEYVRYFSPEFIGVTGDKENILSLEKWFSAYHVFENRGDEGNYSVAHSANIFLVNPEGRYIASFEPPLNVPQLVKQFTALVERSGTNGYRSTN